MFMVHPSSKVFFLLQDYILEEKNNLWKKVSKGPILVHAKINRWFMDAILKFSLPGIVCPKIRGIKVYMLSNVFFTP